MNKCLLACAILSVATAPRFVAAAAPEKLSGGRLQEFIENARFYASLPRLAHTLWVKQPTFMQPPTRTPREAAGSQQ